MKKVKLAIFLLLFTDSKKQSEKILDKNAENFHNALIFFQNFTNSKIKVRTQIFPKMDKNYL
jgi:hypothetical protein